MRAPYGALWLRNAASLKAREVAWTAPHISLMGSVGGIRELIGPTTQRVQLPHRVLPHRVQAVGNKS
ncbi:hypothetical protein HH1059_17700 [Halorhodospira halochloris]|uniref:Uncharacterized protein n=1 Tax=Halorhodospira halochloris TaxID=1052 RepID=A0A2Z6F010_HALHR|nr:hypothetical protein HH1059_17700 [Halorhodospira halochloris]